jgi:hypothetical protein
MYRGYAIVKFSECLSIADDNPANWRSGGELQYFPKQFHFTGFCRDCIPLKLPVSMRGLSDFCHTQDILPGTASK